MDPGPSPDRSIPRIGSPLPYRQTRYSRRPAPARQQRCGFCPGRTPAATGAACTWAHDVEVRRPDYNRGCPGCARPPSFAHRYHRSHGMRGGRLVWGGPPEGLIGAALKGDAERAGATADPATAPPGWALVWVRPGFLAPNSRDLHSPPRPPHRDWVWSFCRGILPSAKKVLYCAGHMGR